MSATEQPADLRDAVEMWVELAVHKYRAANDPVILGECSAESVAEILRLCEAAALAASPDKEGAYEETRRIGCVDDDAQKGYRLAIATYQANIHSVFGGTSK